MRHSEPVTSAADLVTQYLLEQADEVARAGRAVADGDPDGVHDLRVACRRARSVLRSHRTLLRPRARPGAAHLARDLRQLGLDLSGPRDDEVARELVGGWAKDDGWPPDAVEEVLDVLGPAATSPVATSTVRVRASSLGAAVRSWCEHADWRSRASRSPGDALTPVVHRAARRLARRVEAARAATDDQSAEPWHEVRKAAKRVRYTAEVAVPALPRCADVVDAAKALQTALGDRQDARMVLAGLAAVPGPASTALLLATERAHRAVRDTDDAAPAAHGKLLKAVRKID